MLGSPGPFRILTPGERSPIANDTQGGHVEGVTETTVKARARWETTGDHPKARRQRSAVGRRIWPMALGARENVTIVTGSGGGPGTNPSHYRKRKQSCAAAEQLRKGQIDRIFPSEREIAPTVSNKTEGGVTQPLPRFFSHSPPPTAILEHNDPRPQTVPNLIPYPCSLPQEDAICSHRLRPANTDARATLHYPEPTTPAVFTTAEVSTKVDSPQGEPETEPFAQAHRCQDPAGRPPGGYQAARRRIRQAQVSQATVQEPFTDAGKEFLGAG